MFPKRPAFLLSALFLISGILLFGSANGLKWSSDGDWTTGNFNNTTSINGILQVNKSFYREYGPLNDMTAGWWHFNGGGGAAAADSSGNENIGKLGNVSEWNAPTWNQGRFGLGLNFNGSQYVNVTNSSSLNMTSAITVEAWVNLNFTQDSLTGSDSYASVVSKAGSFYLRAYTNSSGLQRAGFWVYVNGAKVGASVATDLRGTGWHMLAGTYDGSIVKLYLDGEVKATSTAPGSIDSTENNIYIGSYNGTGEFFNGTIDEVRILNASLFEGDINLDYSGFPVSAAYGSNTTDFGKQVVAVSAFFDKSEYGFNGAINLTNVTLEVSVNNWSTWRVAQPGAYMNTTVDNGTSLSFRANFATNDTMKGASLSNLVLVPEFSQNLLPNATLISPPSGYSQADNLRVTFNCSAMDDLGLASVSLWHNITGTWHQNATVAVNGTSNYTNFNLNGNFGSFVWNCMAADLTGQKAFAPANYSFSLGAAPALPSLGVSFSPSSTVVVEGGKNGTVTVVVENSANALARNVSLSFTDSACCVFHIASPEVADVMALGTQNFALTVSVLEGASPSQFSTVVTARSQEGAVASAPLTISVIPKSTPTPSPTPTQPPTPTPSPTPDPKVLAEAAIAEANSTILSVDIQIAVAERERKDVRLAVSRLAEARGLLKKAYALMSGESIDYQGALKAAKDATTRANEALSAVPEKGRSPLSDLAIPAIIVVITSIIGFVVYKTFFAANRKKMAISATYQPTQQQYRQYYRSYPYYYPPQQPPTQQQQPRKPQ